MYKKNNWGHLEETNSRSILAQCFAECYAAPTVFDVVQKCCHFQTIDLNDKTFDSYDVNGLGKYGTYGVTIHSYTSGANLTDYVINCTTSEDGT